MTCIILYTTGMYYYISIIDLELYIFNFGYLSTGHLYLRHKGFEDPQIFSKPQGVHEQQVWVTKV
jgi:hypothetical protein